MHCNVQEGETALHNAASGGHRDLVLALLDRGAAIDAVDNVRLSLLYYNSTSVTINFEYCSVVGLHYCRHRNRNMFI